MLSMDGPSENQSRRDVEWLNLAVEATGIGTWEFDLEQGTGFVSERCAEIMGYPEISHSAVDSVRRVAFDDPLGGPEARQSGVRS